MRYVYILRSIGNPEQIYVGVTTNLCQRLNYHNAGRCPHTSKFKPWIVAYKEQFEKAADAFKRELQIKHWTKAKKEALVANDKLTLKKLSKRRIR